MLSYLNKIEDVYKVRRVALIYFNASCWLCISLIVYAGASLF